jgi:hypothetical protein
LWNTLRFILFPPDDYDDEDGDDHRHHVSLKLFRILTISHSMKNVVLHTRLQIRALSAHSITECIQRI